MSLNATSVRDTLIRDYAMSDGVDARQLDHMHVVHCGYSLEHYNSSDSPWWILLIRAKFRQSRTTTLHRSIFTDIAASTSKSTKSWTVFC